MWEGKEVAVVVPAHNEEEHLATVLRTMPAWVDRVVVVDDASTDGTARVASGFAPAVELVRHPQNRGVGRAIATGYRRALALGADVICVMAGDGQMCPEELSALVSPVATGVCDYSKGDRTAHPEFVTRMPPVRRLGTSVLSVWTRWIADLPALADAQSGYTAISASLLRRLPLDRLYARYGYPNDLLVMAGALGARVLDVPITPIYAGQRSGLRPGLAIFSHSYVLGRAWWWKRRLGGPAAVSADRAWSAGWSGAISEAER